MSMENKYRAGIDDRPVSAAEYKRLKEGRHLYERENPPQRPDKAHIEATQRTSA